MLRVWFGLIVFFVSCKENSNSTLIPKTKPDIHIPNDSVHTYTQVKSEIKGWVKLDSTKYSLDIKYATPDNFTQKVIYDCSACYVRDTLGVILNQINNELSKKYNYKLKLFDCYRPAPAQKKLWDIVPNPLYVTNPSKGSMHNRGMAIDVTIVDQFGKELNMGTRFDYFGKKAHIDFIFEDSQINNNRTLLKTTMEKYGLKGIRTEWWHYSLRTPLYPIANWEWECP